MLAINAFEKAGISARLNFVTDLGTVATAMERVDNNTVNALRDRAQSWHASATISRKQQMKWPRCSASRLSIGTIALLARRRLLFLVISPVAVR